MPNLTDHAQIRALCDKYGFSFSKGFGQNFIVNPGICPKICDAAEIDENTNVLEIGPGFGTLTQQLVQRAKKVVSIEIDTRLLPVLEETLAGAHNLTIINNDVLKCDIAALAKQEFDGPFVVCANLPYYITSPVLMRLLEDTTLPLTSITAMVQKEAAERITAAPATRAAGAISYAVSYYSSPNLMFHVQPGSFYPPPKVTSSVIKLNIIPEPPLRAFPEREARLFQLIRASFGQRRKTLANAASAGLHLPKQQLTQALEAVGLSPMIRPEQLSLDNFIQVEAALWPQV